MSSAQRFLPQCWPHGADFIGSIPFGVALPSSSPFAAPSPGYAESRAAPVQSPALLSGPTGHPHHRQRLESVDLQYFKGECQISVYMHVRTHSSVLQGRSGCSCDTCFILLHFLAWCKAASCLVSCTQLCPGAVRGGSGWAPMLVVPVQLSPAPRQPSAPTGAAAGLHAVGHCWGVLWEGAEGLWCCPWSRARSPARCCVRAATSAAATSRHQAGENHCKDPQCSAGAARHCCSWGPALETLLCECIQPSV